MFSGRGWVLCATWCVSKPQEYPIAMSRLPHSVNTQSEDEGDNARRPGVDSTPYTRPAHNNQKAGFSPLVLDLVESTITKAAHHHVSKHVDSDCWYNTIRENILCNP
jgi:hypothetical protein